MVDTSSNDLKVIDISDPPSAAITLQRRFPSDATAVAARGNIAFVGLANGEIRMIDMFSGLEFGRYDVLPAAVQDLAVRDDRVYALVAGELHTIDVNGGQL